MKKLTNYEMKRNYIQARVNAAGMSANVFIAAKGYGIRCKDTGALFIGGFSACIEVIENFQN